MIHSSRLETSYPTTPTTKTEFSTYERIRVNGPGLYGALCCSMLLHLSAQNGATEAAVITIRLHTGLVGLRELVIVKAIQSDGHSWTSGFS